MGTIRVNPFLGINKREKVLTEWYFSEIVEKLEDLLAAAQALSNVIVSNKYDYSDVFDYLQQERPDDVSDEDTEALEETSRRGKFIWKHF